MVHCGCEALAGASHVGDTGVRGRSIGRWIAVSRCLDLIAWGFDLLKQVLRVDEMVV
jgi:hypothetical protein